jgi:hypothetical protein
MGSSGSIEAGTAPRRFGLSSPNLSRVGDVAAERAGTRQPLDPADERALSRGERAEVLSLAPIQPSSNRADTADIGGATARQRPRARGPSLPSMTVVNVPGHGAGTYPTLGPALTAMTAQGASERDVFAVPK